MASPKAPEAFRTISEVAGDLELPQHVLRFWETRFAQIRPMKRGGGRRYYRPEDVDLLRGIRLLLYGEGFTIRGVQRLLKENGVGFVVSVGQTGSVHTVAAAEGGTERAGASRQRVRAAQEAAGPQSAGSQAASAPRVYALSPDKRRRMQAALDDLDEAKRLLDQAR